MPCIMIEFDLMLYDSFGGSLQLGVALVTILVVAIFAATIIVLLLLLVLFGWNILIFINMTVITG